MSLQKPDTGKRWSGRLWLAASFLLPMIWLGVMRFYVMGSDGENALDAFYHAGMAKHGAEVYLAKTFPWTQLSIWGKTFADKELLYHVALDVIFRTERLFGIDPQPPFHFAAMLFIGLAILSWLFACCRLGLAPPMIFASTLFFTMMTPNYIYRLMMLRPHVLSIAYLFFMIGILAKGSFRFRLIAVCLTSFIYSWTYSNPHFIAMIPFAFAFAGCRREGWKVWLLPAASLLCVATGCLIHPQMPNSLAIWKLQSWDAMFVPMTEGVLISKPTEMLPPTFKWYVPILPMFAVAYAAFFLLIRLAERVGIRKVSTAVWALALLAGVFTAGAFLVMRAIEYTTPFLALLLLLVFEEARTAGLRLPFTKFRYGPVCMFFAVSMALAIFSSATFCKETPHGLARPLYNIGAWLKANVPAGETVVNLDWSDFPQLFYSDDTHNYLWGMDPIFAYGVDPARTLLLTRTHPQFRKQQTRPEVIQNAFRSKYAVLLWPRGIQAQMLYRHGWHLVKEFLEPGKEEGWIFVLDENEYQEKYRASFPARKL